MPSFTGESIPRLVHVSRPRSFLKHYLLFISFIINDVILTAFRIILTTWLYKLQVIYKAKQPVTPDQQVKKYK